MKKNILALLLSTFLSGYGFAQLDITQVFFSNNGSTAGNIMTDSIPINSTKFIIAVYQNNLPGNQGMVDTDSISFGYSVGGTKVGEIGRLVGRTVASGNQVPFIVDDSYNTGTTERWNVEMCVWSLYNEYSPETMDNNNTELCRNVFNFYDPSNIPGPSGIASVASVQDVSAFYARSAVQVLLSGAQAGKNLDLQIIDLTGQVVLEKTVEINQSGDVYESIDFGNNPHGIYLLNVRSTDYSKTLKFVKN